MGTFGSIADSTNRARNNEVSRLGRHQRIANLKKVFATKKKLYEEAPIHDKPLTEKELKNLKQRIRLDIDSQKQRQIFLLIPMSLIIFTLIAYGIFWAFYLH